MSITTRVKATDMLPQMGLNVYRTAYQDGMSLSAFLERQDPSGEYRDGTDAFQRLLQAADLRVETLPHYGVQASTFGDFLRTESTRALIPEWLLREWRSVQTGRPFSTRAMYSTADGAAGSWERPYAEAMTPRTDQQIAPAIPLSQLVAITTPINSAEYRSYYLTNDEDQTSMVRVAEGAEVPRVKLTGSQHVINLLKYGRALEASYEVLKRQRVDRLALTVRMMAAQAEADKVAAIISVMVNGDGNNNAPTTHNLTTLDAAATAGALTLKGWLAFKMKFVNPYVMTGALAREDVALQMFLLNTGSANTPLVNVQQPSGLGAFTQMNPGLRDSVALGWTADAPALKIVGFDRRFAIERVVDVGMTITEIERFITRQVEVLVVTEAEGYAVIDKQAINVLDVNA